MTNIRPVLARVKLLLLIVWLNYGVFSLAMAQPAGHVLTIEAQGPVTPVMLGYIERAIEAAEQRNAEALVIQLDTPGGQVDLTKRIIQTIIGANLPVVIYVAPPGAHAGSAGTFITLAGHAAAMAPNTSIGAASPINQSGQDVDETLRAKIENILTADIRGLTERRGERAVEWAQETVTKAKAASATEALELGIIDFVAEDMEDLLQQLDGFTVEVRGEIVVLDTAAAPISTLNLTIFEEILNLIANPSVALMLISIGGLAIVYELINPGGYMGGVIGLICLLTGMYGVGQLPVNYAGLALIFLSFILFVAEIFTPTYGALTASGVAAFILGGLLLFNTSEFAHETPWTTIVSIPMVLAGVFTFGIAKVAQSTQKQPTTGQEGIIGAVGTVRMPLTPQGTVFVWGELWNAQSENQQPIEAQTLVKVVTVQGLKLTVRRQEQSAESE